MTETTIFPLTEEQFAILGRITAVFGAIDFQIEMMIIVLSGTDAWSLEIMVGKAPFSAKVDMLSEFGKSSKKISDGARLSIRELCSHLRRVTPRRNLAVHGWWGTKQDSLRSQNGIMVDDGTRVTAALSRERVLLATELQDLLAEAEEGLSLACEAGSQIMNRPTTSGATEFFFADPTKRVKP